MAERYVDRFLVADGHCDSLVLRWQREDPLDLGAVPNPEVDAIYQVDLRRLREGGMDCLFTFVGDSNFMGSSDLIDACYEMERHHPADFAVCTTASAVRAAREAGRIALVMTIEGQSMFAENLRHLRNWHRLGVRMASITHGGGRRGHGPDPRLELQHDPSYFGLITPEERENVRRQSKGLTPFAREALAEMARLDIAVDLAHVNDTAFWEVLDIAECPVCYTHGGCYAISPHSRALTDEMMAALAEKGGVMGIAFYKVFIDPQAPSLERLCDHFVHALEIMGPDGVAIGSDFDGTSSLHRPIPEDVSQMEVVLAALAKCGVSDDVLRGVAGENWLRMLPA
jgi:membrane dipeptidase